MRGVIPRLGQGVWAIGKWLVRHPQAAVVSLGLCAMSWSVWVYMHHDEAFRIVRVGLPAEATLKLPEPLIGLNLWELDIRGLAEELKSQQPWLKEVRVIRQLPNSLRIEVIERTPIAQVQLDLPAAARQQAGRWYPVDQEGFILPQGTLQASSNLVRLVGTQTPHALLKAGRLNTSEPLQLALRVLDTLKRHRALFARRLNAVDVSNPGQISFAIDAGTEIRCGSEAELSAHLQRLQVALRTVARQHVDAHYIDVRFQEPVVSPRT